MTNPIKEYDCYDCKETFVGVSKVVRVRRGKGIGTPDGVLIIKCKQCHSASENIMNEIFERIERNRNG